MAVKVRVRNFQSIADASLVIDGLTVVTGSNNSGKTALVRAIRGAFQNTRGSAFVRHGAKKCTVELEFDDGRTLKWEKGPKHPPTYTIDGGEPIRPGQGVPPEVQALGVAPLVINKQQVWPQVANQFTGQVFLLDQPGSTLAEAVADVGRVGALNKALRSSDSDKRSAQATLKVRRTDLTLAEAEALGFEGLDDAAGLVVDIEQGIVRAEKLAKAVEGVAALQTRHTRAAGLVESLAGIEALDDLPDMQAAEDLLVELEALEALRETHKTAAAEVSLLAGIEGLDINVDFGPAKKLANALDVLAGLQTRLQRARESALLQESALDKAERELVEAEAEAVEVLGTFEECPTCGGVVDHEHPETA
jgi:exonuclease SbcC